MKVILIMAITIILAGCNSEPRTYKYIETERGVISYAFGYCQLGLLLNNDGDNIYDENSNPIPCNGYVRLTKQQAIEAGVWTK